MALLLLSTLALLVGPLLHRILARAGWAMAALDGFVLVVVGGVVLGRLLPHAYEQAGWPAILVAGVGYVAVRQLERLQRLGGQRAHDAALLLGVLGFSLHELLDGVALATGGGDHPADALLPLAIVLHRVPIGLAVWWLMRPRLGTWWTLAGLAFIAAATVLGYLLGAKIPSHFDGLGAGIFQGLVGGALLHLVAHNDAQSEPGHGHGHGHVHAPEHAHAHRHDTAHEPALRLGAAIGGLCAIGLLVLMQSEFLPSGRGGEASMARTFMLLAMESAPALLVAYAAAGLIGVFLPQAGVAWLGRGSTLSQAARGVAFGLPLPLCSCGVLPVYRSLVARGVPAAAALAFLVAGPELGIDAVLLSFPLLGLRLTVARLVCAALAAVGVGALVGKLASGRGPTAAAQPLPEAGSAPLGQRLRLALRLGLIETVDHTGPWILLGLAIAAAIEPLVSREWLAGMPAGLEVPLFALLGIPMYVCASAATPIMAVLIHKGISPGAAIAFLLTGPATNVTTFGILAQLHGRRIAAWFMGAIAGAAVLLGLVTNAALGDQPGYPFHVGHQHTSLLYPLCVGLLGLLFLGSFLRQGPRGFLDQLSSVSAADGEPVHAPARGLDDDHDHPHRDQHQHGHGHGHSHSHQAHTLG